MNLPIQPWTPFRNLRHGDRILLAFSGGIDSAIATHLCKQYGLDVLAVNMRLLPGSEKTSPAVQAAADALGVPLVFLDLQKEFRECVMRCCWEIFDSGKTPNPCTICNPLFKFGKLMDFAKANGCAGMATGHYARIFMLGADCVLARGVHRAKDQSYFLFGLTPEQLAFSYFPLGNMTKGDVRTLADSLGLPNAKSKESQDACFAPENGSMAELLRNEFQAPVRNGCFIHAETGKILGRHKGIHAYTIGQRKGTGVALGAPAYVQKIDPEHNNVYITGDEQTLFQDSLTVSRMNRHSAWTEQDAFHADIQIRYRTPAAPATVIPGENGRCQIRFDSPMRAITPGQAAVVYDGDFLLGGGFIA